jgi:hypothetical protein
MHKILSDKDRENKRSPKKMLLSEIFVEPLAEEKKASEIQETQQKC